MSSKIAIKAENISKQYRLGEVGTGTISHDINRWWAKMRGKEDPFLKIGESNDRTSKGESDYVWSLRDISFEIQQGDAVGIIGRNGAGKSTLLKLLSKVTKPTTGSFKVKGRIASLLEVGTGFHPEMTGRENIYLNGAILGMRKHEIKRKFDEIVDFSGVERYIDTPVKRYSSGMYVRLAFAVAAHLESEILIVDEVLAVGDAEFQKKCLGKMSDVSKGEGRTVLFVSHNMAAVEQLCNKGIFLKNGSIYQKGPIELITKHYWGDITTLSNNTSLENRKDREGSGALKFTGYELLDTQNNKTNAVNIGEDLKIKLLFNINHQKWIDGIHLSINIISSSGICLVSHSSKLIGKTYTLLELQKGYIHFVLKNIQLLPGEYFFNLDCVLENEWIDRIDYAGTFEINDKVPYNYVNLSNSGVLVPNANWVSS
jgi:lipopolysaccharide transport system ATP-binding protein